MFDEIERMIDELDREVGQGVQAAAEYLVLQLKRALPRRVRHRGKFAPIADGVKCYPEPAGGAGRRKRRSRSRDVSALPPIGISAGGKRWVVDVPWPWLPNEVGHYVGYEKRVDESGKRRKLRASERKSMATGYVAPKPIVRQTFDANAEKLGQIITGEA